MGGSLVRRPVAVPAWLIVVIGLLGPGIAVAGGWIAKSFADGQAAQALHDVTRRVDTVEADTRATREAVIDIKADIRWMRQEMERRP